MILNIMIVNDYQQNGRMCNITNNKKPFKVQREI